MSDLNLSNKIELYVGRKIDFLKEVFLQDDGQGAYIKDWNIADTPKPTDEQLERFEKEAQAKLNLSEIHDKRRFEYPSIGDQLDALFHAGVFPAEMAARIQAVKDKYPKEQT
jgi:hypothetical protein